MMDKEKEGTKSATPRTKLTSNAASNTPREFGFIQYV
jgi:hypothetical protein